MARKSKKSKRSKSNRRRTHRIRGGGYSEVLNNSIYPGQQIHREYTGPGYDSPPVPIRSGTMTDIGVLRVPGGLPGLSPPGSRMIGGANQLGSGGPYVPQAAPYTGQANGPVPSGSPPILHQQQPIGGSLVHLGTEPAQRLAPEPPLYHGGRSRSSRSRSRRQSGGRWGAVPEQGPLNPSNGVGTIGSPFARIPCERGTSNALNPNPGGVQQLTTDTPPSSWAQVPASLPGWTGMTNMVKNLVGMNGGGKRRKNRKNNKKNRLTRRQSGGRFVGDVASMAYYAPTAGYGNYPMAPGVQNNPGILMQVGYPARHFNEACIKTT